MNTKGKSQRDPSAPQAFWRHLTRHPEDCSVSRQLFHSKEEKKLPKFAITVTVIGVEKHLRWVGLLTSIEVAPETPALFPDP